MGQDYLPLIQNYTLEYLKGGVMGYDTLDVALFKTLEGFSSVDQFMGEHIEQIMRTTRPFTGEAFYERKDIVAADSWEYERTMLKNTEFMVNTELTIQAIERAAGRPNSWGNIVMDALDLLQDDRDWLMKLSAIGDGTGRLGVVKGNTGITESSDTFTVTLDNTYDDFGWDNCWLLRPGMKIDIRNASGADLGSTCNGLRIDSVTQGTRSTSGYAAVDGTFTFTTTAALVGSGEPLENPDNFIVYLSGSAGSIATAEMSAGTTASDTTKLMTGLTGIVTDNVIFGSGAHAYFQGRTRATHPALKSQVTRLNNGVPTDSWDATTISNVVRNLMIGNYRVKPSDLVILCNSRIAMAMHNLNISATYGGAGGISVTVPNGQQAFQAVTGSRIAQAFIAPDGTPIPIVIDETLPPHYLFVLNKPNFTLYRNGWGFVSDMNTGVWMRTAGGRKLAYEAPYRGWVQLGVDRCDTCAVLSDLGYNI